MPFPAMAMVDPILSMGDPSHFPLPALARPESPAEKINEPLESKKESRGDAQAETGRGQRATTHPK